MLYILQGKEIIKTDDTLAWAQWFERPESRRVAEDYVGTVRISTVFLGVDHGSGVGELPLVFETMVFGGDLDEAQVRYHTYAEAEQGHHEMVQQVLAPLKQSLSMLEASL